MDDLLKQFDDHVEGTRKLIKEKLAELKRNGDDDERTLRFYTVKIIQERFKKHPLFKRKI